MIGYHEIAILRKRMKRRRLKNFKEKNILPCDRVLGLLGLRDMNKGVAEEDVMTERALFS